MRRIQKGFEQNNDKRGQKMLDIGRRESDRDVGDSLMLVTHN